MEYTYKTFASCIRLKTTPANTDGLAEQQDSENKTFSEEVEYVLLLEIFQSRKLTFFLNQGGDRMRKSNSAGAEQT